MLYILYVAVSMLYKITIKIYNCEGFVVYYVTIHTKTVSTFIYMLNIYTQTYFIYTRKI